MSLFPRELRASERGRWLAGLASDCDKRARITVTDRSWDVVGSTLVNLQELQTTIDTSADTDRRMDVTCVDSGGLLERSGLLLWHVEVLHRIGSLGREVASPIGVYVPNRMERKGREVRASLPDLEAQWAVNVPRNAYGAIAQGQPVTAAARELLQNLGHRRFRWYTAKERDGKKALRLVRTNRRWQYGGPDDNDRPVEMVRRMLAAHGIDFFFDGAGYAVARPVGNRPLYDIDDYLLRDSPIAETTEWLKAYNRVVVQSGEGKKAMYGRWDAPDWHPASAKKRAANGVPIPHTMYVDSESRVKARLQEIARDRGWAQLADHRSITARCLPLPLDPLDRVRVTTDAGPVTSPLRQASVDWLGEGGMEIGVSRRLTTRRPRRRRGKR